MRLFRLVLAIGLTEVSYAQQQGLVLGGSTIWPGMTEEEVFKALGGVTSKSSAPSVTMIETGNGEQVLLWYEGQEHVVAVANKGTVRITGGLVTSVSRTWGSWVSGEGRPENKAAGDFARTLFDMISAATGDKPTNAVVRTYRKPGPNEKRECLEICRDKHCYGFCSKTSQPAAPIQLQQAFLYEEISR